MPTAEERERALENALMCSDMEAYRAEGAGNPSAVARSLREILRDCIPVPRDELARYKRAIVALGAIKELVSGPAIYSATLYSVHKIVHDFAREMEAEK